MQSQFTRLDQQKLFLPDNFLIVKFLFDKLELEQFYSSLENYFFKFAALLLIIQIDVCYQAYKAQTL